MVASALALVGLTTSEAIEEKKEHYACVERANVPVSRGQLQKKVDMPASAKNDPPDLSTCHVNLSPPNWSMGSIASSECEFGWFMISGDKRGLKNSRRNALEAGR